MVQELTTQNKTSVIYPDQDGKSMADNTTQFRWIVLIKENLELLFADQENVFVAGDLLWYPVQNNNKIRQAPDVMVVMGRPKGERGSYKQWEEENIVPQVVFEILSPGNRLAEMFKKLKFYEQYGVEEYYVYDPYDPELIGWIRSEDGLDVISEMNGWKSPQLGICFETGDSGMKIYKPNGEAFLSFVELNQIREQEKQRADTEKQRADIEKQRADILQEELQTERSRYEQLQEKLKAQGIDPDAL